MDNTSCKHALSTRQYLLIPSPLEMVGFSICSRSFFIKLLIWELRFTYKYPCTLLFPYFSCRSLITRNTEYQTQNLVRCILLSCPLLSCLSFFLSSHLLFTRHHISFMCSTCMINTEEKLLLKIIFFHLQTFVYVWNLGPCRNHFCRDNYSPAFRLGLLKIFFDLVFETSLNRSDKLQLICGI